MNCKVGTAGWSVPGEFRRADASHLVQYASTFDAVEINSSFYKVHRTATYQRWAASVPAHFRFSVKLTKTITHEAGLADCRDEVAAFCDSVAGLGSKLGVVLVQLPRSLEFDRRRANTVFTSLQKRRLNVPLVCEPRHLSWFGPAADRLLGKLNIDARVRPTLRSPRSTSTATMAELPTIVCTASRGSTIHRILRRILRRLASMLKNASASGAERLVHFRQHCDGRGMAERRSPCGHCSRGPAAAADPKEMNP